MKKQHGFPEKSAKLQSQPIPETFSEVRQNAREISFCTTGADPVSGRHQKEADEA